LRSDETGENTRIFGIIGFPVKHSLSPHFQNAAFAYLGMNAEYVTFEIAPEELEDKFRELSRKGVSGVNVTIPHKQAVLRLVDECSSEAKAIGAVNTVVFKDGRSTGYNTDAEGFLLSLRKDLQLDPKNKSVLMIGSGGAAQAIAYILAKEGSGSLLFNDSIPGRAEDLASKIKSLFPSCKTGCVEGTVPEMKRAVQNIDLLINASPVGMKGKDDHPLPVTSVLHKNLAVYDIVYNPSQTPLLREARTQGAKAANGLGMLLYQGVLSFELFTGRKAPVEAMRAALKKAVE